MARELRRTWIIEPQRDPETGLLQADRPRLAELLDALEGTLFAFGGKVQIVADRLRIGVVPAQGADPSFPLAETVGYIVEYDEGVPLQEQSMTLRIAETADAELGARERRPEPPEEPTDRHAEPEDLDVDEHTAEPVPASA